MSPVDLLLKFISEYQEGSVLLPHGQSAWHVSTKFTPGKVYISESEQGNLPVCNGGVNCYSVSLQPDGFVLLADVRTEHAAVEWNALAEDADENPGPRLV